MRKKVIDIYPPCERGEEKESFSPQPVGGKCKKRGVVFAALVFFCLAAYFYYTSYRTEIVVYPATEKFQAEEEVLVRAFGSIGDKEVRGVVLSEKVSDTRKFPIEGKRTIEEKATGEIKVCQDYRDSAVLFREGTRFISDGGKTFLAKDSFTLPPRKENDGCAMVEVVAGEAGEEYNISADSKFALPGLEGTSSYGNVKGVSFTIHQEGVLKEVPYLDDNTMERAEAQMREELFEKGKELLKEKYGEEYLVESEAQYVTEVVERDFTEEEKEGEAENFFFRLDVAVKVIAIGKEDTDRLISTLLPDNYTWRKETEELNMGFRRINFTDGEADILLDFSADIYEKFDQEEWRRKVAGLGFSDAERMIEEETSVKKVSIATKPFGLSRISESLHRVEVMLEFDKN